MTRSHERIEKEAAAPRTQPHPPAAINITLERIVALVAAAYAALLLLALLVRPD